MMMDVWTEYHAHQARKRRAAQLARAGRLMLTVAATIFALTVAIGIVRAAAITGANLPHTLEQAARF